jgi:hypothetical protein
MRASNAVDVFHLGGEHDDGREVVRGAQAAADRQAVFAGQHQVEHDQIDRLAGQHPVQCFRVLGQQDFKTFLREVAAKQVADARIVIDDDDTVGAGVGGSGHRSSPENVTTAILRRFAGRFGGA